LIQTLIVEIQGDFKYKFTQYVERRIMLTEFYRKIADFEKEGSLALKVRKQRFQIFKDLIDALPRPLRILDVGGTEVFWEIMGFAGCHDFEIVILNIIDYLKTSYDNLTYVKGDARDLSPFKDNEFDVVFSNSVIEHVGSYQDQEKMALEIQRVGKVFFVQTPNYYSPF